MMFLLESFRSHTYNSQMKSYCVIWDYLYVLTWDYSLVWLFSECLDVLGVVRRNRTPLCPISPCTLRAGRSVSTPAGSWLFISSEVAVINEALNTSSFPWTSWVNRPRYSKSDRFGSTATGSQNAATQTPKSCPQNSCGDGVRRESGSP